MVRDSAQHGWFQEPAPGDWTRQFRLGVLVGLNVSADFKMGGLFGISGSAPGPVGVTGADHVFDDGYVRVDQTGNAQGVTSYWGYNSSSQYDAASQTLRMHSASSYSASGGASRDDSPYVGFDLAYGASPWRWHSARIGWEFGFNLLPINIRDNQSLSATISQSSYSFDTGGIVLPSAPYHGGPGGIGPTIHDVATLLGTATAPAVLSGSRTLDVTLYALRLGPSVYLDLGRHFGLTVAAGPALGIVDGNYKFDETITSDEGTAHNVGKAGATKLVFGGYVDAMLTYHAIERLDIYFGVQFMPMGNANFSAAGRESRLNLGGQVYLSAGFNWPF